MAFSVDAALLKDTLEQIAKGEIQLPDFQRGWVWDDPHIASLIASISLAYPIGAVMFLEAAPIASLEVRRPVLIWPELKIKIAKVSSLRC